MTFEAIVLCGGMGTRLKSVTGDLPKPMVDIAGRPFLDYHLAMLAQEGFRHVVLAAGYGADSIQRYFGDSRFGMKLSYAIEQEPLGTGGAVCNALSNCEQEFVFVLNGDTFAQVDFPNMMRQHETTGSDITICGKWMDDCDRYGALEIDKEMRITLFREKESGRSGYINAGIYLMKRTVLPCERMKFSLEKDMLEVNTEHILMKMHIIKGFFIDIGVPHDYSRAIELLPKWTEAYF